MPPEATHGLDLLYAGQTDQALAEFHQVEAAAPDDPLGYLLEADALWWRIYCEACTIKWNMIDAWERPHMASDDAYLALVDKARSLAEARIAKSDTAQMELYSGIAWMFRARLLGLRDDRRATARAGVETRSHMLRCLQLDPQMADAYAGLGLYNYYVDTLSALAKMLRFFMGIPGGDKQEGIRQLHIAMQQGTLTRAEARLYLAKNLRTYDRDYAGAIEVMSPLVAQYPQNPIFRLLLGDMQAKLARDDLARAEFRAATDAPASDGACAQHVRGLVEQASRALASAGRN